MSWIEIWVAEAFWVRVGDCSPHGISSYLLAPKCSFIHHYLLSPVVLSLVQPFSQSGDMRAPTQEEQIGYNSRSIFVAR